MANVIGSLFVELGVNTAAFVEGMNKATYSAKVSATAIGSAFKGIGGALTELTSEFGQFGGIVGAALGSAGTAMSKVAKEFLQGGGGIGKALGLAGVGAIGLGAAAATAGAAVIGIAVHAAEGASRLHELSQSTGVAVQELSGLSIIGKLAGVGIEQLAKGLERMDKSAMAAAQSPQKASNAYRTLGISVLDASGHLKNTTDLFGEVASKFSVMEDGATKTALAMQIFGRAGAELIPVLNKGPEAIKYWIDYGTKVGAVLSKDAAEGAHNFEEQLTKLGLISEGVQNKLMAALLPAIDHIVVAFTSFAEKGDTIAHFGEVVGNVLVTTTGWVFKAVYAWEYWSNKLDVWAAKYKKFAGGLTLGESLMGSRTPSNPENNAALDKQIKEAEDKITKANDRLAIELADLGSKFIMPVAPGSKGGTKKQAPMPAEKGVIAKPEKDYAGDLIARAQQATQAELEMAGAIGQSTAALLLQKAASEAGLKVGDTLIQITDRLKVLGEEEASAAKAGSTAKVKAIQNQIDALHRQEIVLINSKDQLAALFETKAVATFALEVGKSFETVNQKLKEQIAGMKTLAAASNQGGQALIAATIEEKLSGDKAKVAELSEAYRRLATDQNVSANDLSALAAILAKANGDLERHRDLLQQEHDATIANEAAHLNLTARLADENLKFGELMAAAKGADAQMLILAQHQGAVNKITTEWDNAAIAVGSFSAKVRAMVNELALESQNSSKKIFDAFKTALDGISTNFAEMVVKGKASWASLFDALEIAIIKQVASQALNALIKKLSSLGSSDDGGDGGGGGFLGGMGSFFGSLFGGGKAEGGPVAPGVSYLVGENGPEKFVPSTPGTIVPNAGSSQSNVTAAVNIHVHGATDADSFRKSAPQVASEMYRQLQMAAAHSGSNF